MVSHLEYSSLEIVLNDLSQTNVKNLVLQFNVNNQQNQTCSQTRVASGLDIIQIQLIASSGILKWMLGLSCFTPGCLSYMTFWRFGS